MTVTEPGAPDRYAERDFGFWLFLMTDAVVFALLFATYAVLVQGTAGGPAGRDLFSLPHTFASTLLLLVSSTTFGFASLFAQTQERGAAILWLLVTGLLGAGFLVLTMREFGGMIAAGAGPGRSGFLSAFFVLVGTHALHVAAGLVCLIVMVAQVLVKGLTPPVLSRLYRTGLFWHLLDIVWIGVFSVVYLMGML